MREATARNTLALMFFFLALFWIFGCESDDNRSASVRSLAAPDPVNLRIKREINLNVGDSKHVIDINSFQKTEDRLLILDGFYAQQAYEFDFSGNLLKTVGETGSGPGEYRLPGGFCFSKTRYHVINSSERKHNIYDADGRFLKWVSQKSRGIGFNLYPGKKGTVYATAYSRYSPDASIYWLDENGELKKKFSPLDEDFVQVFDVFFPPGGLVITNDGLIQFFNHRYEVIFWTFDGQEKDRIRLHSSKYIEPQYKKAKGIVGHKAEIKFMHSFSQFVGFFQFGSGYVSVLRRIKSKDKMVDTIEFWDDEFRGVGRYLIPEDEKLIGVLGDSLVFSQETDENLILILKAVTATQ